MQRLFILTLSLFGYRILNNAIIFFYSHKVLNVYKIKDNTIDTIMNKKTIVTGVIGADVHAVGNKILTYALEEAGFEMINLGVMVSQEEFVEAAVETNADAILVSSLYGHGEIDCNGLREKCDEAGLKDIPLLAGGNLVLGSKILKM